MGWRGWSRIRHAIVAPVRAVNDARKQVTHEVVHAGQVVVRSPIVQAMATAYLTVQTGGAAAALMGGGAVATGAATAAVSGVVSKLEGHGFNLQDSIKTGVLAGLPVSGAVGANIATTVKTVETVQNLRAAIQDYHEIKKQNAEVVALQQEIATYNAPKPYAPTVLATPFSANATVAQLVEPVKPVEVATPAKSDNSHLVFGGAALLGLLVFL